LPDAADPPPAVEAFDPPEPRPVGSSNFPVQLTKAARSQQLPNAMVERASVGDRVATMALVGATRARDQFFVD
jgi:hypothetical protein